MKLRRSKCLLNKSTICKSSILKDKKGWIGFSYAFNGIKTVILTERNFQIHLVCMFLVLGIGFLLNINRYEWLILLLVISLVLITEMINSRSEEHTSELQSRFDLVCR